MNQRPPGYGPGELPTAPPRTFEEGKFHLAVPAWLAFASRASGSPSALRTGWRTVRRCQLPTACPYGLPSCSSAPRSPYRPVLRVAAGNVLQGFPFWLAVSWASSILCPPASAFCARRLPCFTPARGRRPRFLPDLAPASARLVYRTRTGTFARSPVGDFPGGLSPLLRLPPLLPCARLSASSGAGACLMLPGCPVSVPRSRLSASAGCSSEASSALWERFHADRARKQYTRFRGASQYLHGMFSETSMFSTQRLLATSVAFLLQRTCGRAMCTDERALVQLARCERYFV